VAAKAAPKYVACWLVMHNGVSYWPGQVIELSDADAKRLLDTGVVRLADEPKAGEP
jgi:hypothetical protein